MTWTVPGDFLLLGPSLSCRMAAPSSSLGTLSILTYIVVPAFSLSSPYPYSTFCLQSLGIRASQHPATDSCLSLLPPSLQYFPSITIKISLIV